MLKWWKNLDSMDRFLFRNVLWGTFVILVGMSFNSWMMIAGGIVIVGVATVLVEFFGAVVNEANKRIERVYVQKRDVQKPSSDGGATGSV